MGVKQYLRQHVKVLFLADHKNLLVANSKLVAHQAHEALLYYFFNRKMDPAHLVGLTKGYGLDGTKIMR